MFSGNIQGLEHAFADRDAGNYDDELAPTVTLVHLEDALDVAISLASTCFHFDI